MKTYNKYIALAAMALSFAACEQEDFTPAMEGDAVKINATIGALQTRVAYGNKGETIFEAGDQIRVQNLSRETKNIATYTLDDNKSWTITGNLVWNSGTDANNQFQAWYPATATFTTFELPTDQSDATQLGAADWMTVQTKAMAKPDDAKLNLDFEHRLVKVTVKIIEWNDQYNNKKYPVTNPIIYSKGNSASYDENSTTVTASGTLTDITAFEVVDDESYTAIVVPGKYESTDTFMTFTVASSINATVLANTTLTGGLVSGKHYTFNLTVGKEKVKISSVSVTPWAEKDIDAGVVESEE